MLYSDNLYYDSCYNPEKWEDMNWQLIQAAPAISTLPFSTQHHSFQMAFPFFLFIRENILSEFNPYSTGSIAALPLFHFSSLCFPYRKIVEDMASETMLLMQMISRPLGAQSLLGCMIVGQSKPPTDTGGSRIVVRGVLSNPL